MNLPSSYLAYLISYRLAIVAAGIVSIVLGYRLFRAGIGVSGSTDAEVEAAVAGTRLTLRNAAPGTCFAVFGAFLIIVMLVTARPEVVHKTLKESYEAVGGLQVTRVSSEAYLRSFTQDEIISILNDYRDGYISADDAYMRLHELATTNVEDR